MNQLSNIVTQAARSENSRNNYNNANNTMPMPTVQQLCTARANRTVPMTLKQYLCFMCKSPEHMMGECPHYVNFMNLGWLVPEAPGSKRVMLRDGIWMPREDPMTAVWQKIEQIAQDRG